MKTNFTICYHHTNCSLIFQLRREGMRLFLLWYQILMDNATDECHKTFASLVPKLNPDSHTSDIDIYTVNIPEGQHRKNKY